MAHQSSWQRFKTNYFHDPSLRLGLDISRMSFPDGYFDQMEGRMQDAFAQMDGLEAGELANWTEGRMVGHYWLRSPELAPPEIRPEIERTLAEIKAFAHEAHSGTGRTAKADRFENLLVIGIGGSALGPQFVADALGGPGDPMRPHFFDNTDPDGMDRVLAQLGPNLAKTLCVDISKSGDTPETRNGMLEAKEAYQEAGLDFSDHAVAITRMDDSSKLYLAAKDERWIEIFPMWEWVGGRTSELSAVGLLPAALQGFDVDAMLAGARAMDEVTRNRTTHENPAALLALMWHHAGHGQGHKDMVIIPYKDRLELLAHYLQQLIMESLGKERDRQGEVVNQGITVYGNKGSTDQHSYVQQLREGIDNFFVTFIEVLRDRDGRDIKVEDGATSGDYLSASLQGTRQALHEVGRESMTITIDEVSPSSIGKLIALFERAVGLYASLVGVNAYDQPGVEAGKKAASTVLERQRQVVAFLRAKPGAQYSAEQLAGSLGAGDPEIIYKILRHLAANPQSGIHCAGESFDPDAAFYAAE